MRSVAEWDITPSIPLNTFMKVARFLARWLYNPHYYDMRGRFKSCQPSHFLLRLFPLNGVES
jgi:hypothetical protein